MTNPNQKNIYKSAPVQGKPNCQAPIFFVHIPKTAGTSFRKAADNFFGEEKCCRDYGAHSDETSKIVIDWMINTQDPWRFKKSFFTEKNKFICGHVQAMKYIPVFGIEHTVTFLREPIQRIISEFNHFVRNHHYTKSFKEFYRTKQFINKQSKMLQGIPWPAIYFIGITEQYNPSLDLINNHFGKNIKKLEVNLGKPCINVNHQISMKHEQEIRKLNAEDILLYKQAYQQFSWRIKLAKEGKIFARGMIVSYENKRLLGWSVYDKGDEPVVINVFVNSKFTGNTIACEGRPQLQAIGIRRGGFVGFSLHNLSLSHGDEITAFVANTGQPLANTPWYVP